METHSSRFWQRIRWGRSLGSYSKVQIWYSRLLRGRSFQLAKVKTAPQRLLNLGCGPYSNEKFINVDYCWMPGIDVCWDISRNLPFSDQRFEGVYSEHCLEHLPLPACRRVLREIQRVLKPGGRFRLVLPDAGLYLEIYQARRQGQTRRFPYERPSEPLGSALMYVNSVFRDYRHQFAFDFETVAFLLTEAGFSNVQRSSFREGANPALLLDQEGRKSESLYVEATV